MCFRLSKKQIITLILFALIGALIGYYLGKPTYVICITAPCNPIPSQFPENSYIYGFLIFGILTYLIEIIYNNYFGDKQ